MKCYVYLRDKNETKIFVQCFLFTKNLSLNWLQTYINFAQDLFYREKSKQQLQCSTLPLQCRGIIQTYKQFRRQRFQKVKVSGKEFFVKFQPGKGE